MTRTMNHRIALFCACLSLLLLVTSAALWLRGGTGRSANAEDLSAACVKEFASLGMAAKPLSGNGVEMSLPLAKDLDVQTWKASIAVSRCSGLKLTSFCAGQGCPRPGMSLVLQ